VSACVEGNTETGLDSYITHEQPTAFCHTFKGLPCQTRDDKMLAQVERRSNDQSPAQTQQAPEPVLHSPLLEVTEQGAATWVMTLSQLHSSSPHTAIVWVAAHTQHSPEPDVQLPVAESAVHGPYCLLTREAVPQLHVSPQTAIVPSCDMRTRCLICSAVASPDRDSWDRTGTATTSTSQAIKYSLTCITYFLQIMCRTHSIFLVSKHSASIIHLIHQDVHTCIGLIPSSDFRSRDTIVCLSAVHRNEEQGLLRRVGNPQ
jgi:hypothetical protein